MKNENDRKNSEEVNFMSSPSLQTAIKKSKKKQTLKYIVIALLTSALFLTIVFSGSQYILNKRLQENGKSLIHSFKGANITSQSTMYIYNLFSVLAETTVYKRIGDRQIVWDKTTKEIPLFGRIDTIKRGSGMSQINRMNPEAKRTVRYNDFNNERRIDFYYPGLPYDYLPNELEIAVELDENKLIEMALSFKEPMTLDELSKMLGHKNVNWLWVDTATAARKKEMSRELDSDSLKTKSGENAYGFSVNELYPYETGNKKGFIRSMEQQSKASSSIKNALKGIKENSVSKSGDLLISGAVVTGTPEELQRFKDLNIIRTSVIGVTIDKY